MYIFMYLLEHENLFLAYIISLQTLQILCLQCLITPNSRSWKVLACKINKLAFDLTLLQTNGNFLLLQLFCQKC